jgi:transcriptional regulator with XRE-family HTH domain
MALASPLEDAHHALRINLVVLRAKRRLSQAELAKRSGVSRTVVSELEQGRGDARLATLARIAGSLGTTVAQLLEPWHPARDTEAELVRRAQAPDEEVIDAAVLLAALDEADGVQRYSRGGRRPSMARSIRDGRS